MLSSVPAVHRLMLHWQWSVRLQERIAQAGLKMKAGKLILMSACLGMGTFVLTGVFTPQFWLGVLLGVAVTFIPYGVVSYLRQKRLQQFEERFPEALDLLGRAVRAGHAFTTGLEMIAKESSEPLASEFRTTFEEQNFGLPLRDALLNMTERIPSIDVRFFVTALLIQKETGGNLAEILDGLARVAAYFYAGRTDGVESDVHAGSIPGSARILDFVGSGDHASDRFDDHLEDYSY
jgi:tight adherence protein B